MGIDNSHLKGSASTRTYSDQGRRNYDSIQWDSKRNTAIKQDGDKADNHNKDLK